MFFFVILFVVFCFTISNYPVKASVSEPPCKTLRACASVHVHGLFRKNVSLVPSPTLESGSGSPHIQSWGSITSAVPDLDRQSDWLLIVLHH